MLGAFRVLLRIATRNLFASSINFVIGAIIFFGTLLVVIGSSLLDSVDGSMSRSIIGSIAGNFQVYSDRSKDEVALYGNLGGEADLSPMTNFPQIKKDLTDIPNVRWVVPMGIGSALVTAGNTVDLTLADLRDVVREEQATGKTPALENRKENIKGHIRQIVGILKSDLNNLNDISSDKEGEQEAREAVARSSSEAFWRDFDHDPLSGLEFLENRVAPQVTDADLLQIRYVGTDLDEFQQAFDRLQVVEGERVPPRHRGMLLSTRFYEDFLKLKTARRLDRIKEVLDTGHGRETIASNPDLQRYIHQNQNQTREIIFQLDKPNTERAISLLQRELKSTKLDLQALLTDFFDMNDANFLERYQFFYSASGLAPLLKLYRLRIGDSLSIKSFTKSGYMESANVKIYGTYEFKGMGTAPLAGAINLMDLMTFRDLFGYLSNENVAEIHALQAEAGARSVDRADAEEELFGNGQVVQETKPNGTDRVSETLKGLSQAHTSGPGSDTFTQAQLDNGVVLNAAVILKNPEETKQTLKAIKDLNAQDHLGLKISTWQQASGILGQMILVLKLVLYFFVFVIFFVALVIINNAMMMATLQRVREIGTLRAVGAQKGFVLGMVLLETAALGLVFGVAGAAVGSGVIILFHHLGIPAGTNEFFRFFFSGPVLYPTLKAVHFISAFVIVVVVSAISTLYPAIVATRVSPLRAMQSEE